MALTVGPLRAEERTKVRGAVRVDLGVTTAEVPVTLVNGAAPGARVVISGGVHGGEFVGVDAATRLAAELDPGKIRQERDHSRLRGTRQERLVGNGRLRERRAAPVRRGGHPG